MWSLPAGSSPKPASARIASSAAKLPAMPGHRAEHAQLRAGVAILGVERVADEAAVAGRCPPPSRGRCRSAPGTGRSRPRRAGCARAVHGRRRSAASRNCPAVEDQVGAVEQRGDIGRASSRSAPAVEARRPGLSRADRLAGDLGLRPADIAGAEQHLALEIVERRPDRRRSPGACRRPPPRDSGSPASRSRPRRRSRSSPPSSLRCPSPPISLRTMWRA